MNDNEEKYFDFNIVQQKRDRRLSCRQG